MTKDSWPFYYWLPYSFLDNYIEIYLYFGKGEQKILI